MTAIETKDLTYLYSQGTPFEKAAVDGVSVSIEEGDFVGVIGHTGSGKSTFIQHLNGLLRPTSGQVLLYGKDIWEEPKKIREVRFQVGLVFQYPEYQLFEETVERDIAFGPSNMGLSPGEIRDRVREAAGFVGLSPDTMQKSPFELSGGQKRRVAIAGVLAMRPRVLILDEPTDHLDMESITALNNGLIKFPGVILFASRDHQVVQTTANRIIEFLPDGTFVDKVSSYDEYLENDEMARKRQVYSMSDDDASDN